MLKRAPPTQLKLFGSGSLERLVPDGHDLVRADRILDLGRLQDEVTCCCGAYSGRPGIDPETAARLMLLGIVHDRCLMPKSRRTSRSVGSSAAGSTSGFRTVRARRGLAGALEPRSG